MLYNGLEYNFICHPTLKPFVVVCFFPLDCLPDFLDKSRKFNKNKKNIYEWGLGDSLISLGGG